MVFVSFCYTLNMRIFVSQHQENLRLSASMLKLSEARPQDAEDQQLSSSVCQMCRAGRDETTVSGYRWCFLFIVLLFFVFLLFCCLVFFYEYNKGSIKTAFLFLISVRQKYRGVRVCEWMREAKIKSKNKERKWVSQAFIVFISLSFHLQ